MLQTETSPKSTQLQALMFLLLSMVVSCLNDVISKFLGENLHALEVSFFRFSFGFLTLLPVVAYKKINLFATKNAHIHVIRGLFGAVSLYLSTYSVMILPIPEVTVIFWTIPLFELLLGTVFLKEKLSWKKCVATFVGFFGLSFLTLSSSSSFSFSLAYLAPIIASVLFAVQDVLVKTVVEQEDSVTMLTYFSFVAAGVTLVPTILNWVTPTISELAKLFFLGLGGNFIQFFAFKAFSLSTLTALAPYRYLEFLISALFSFLFFSEMPQLKTLLSVLILVPSTLYVTLTDA